MNLDAIGRAQAILAELHRREQTQAIESYRPRTDPQRQFHASPARIRLFAGSNMSGKTTALVTETVAIALGYRPWDGKQLASPPARCMLCAASFTHAADEDLIPMIEQFLPASMVKSVDRLANGRKHKWTLVNGSIIKLMSYDQDPVEFEGTRWTFIGFNEPPPKKIWAACLRGAKKGKGRLAFAATPTGPDSVWMYTDLYQKADGQFIDVIVADMDRGHSFLSAEDAEEFKRGIDPDEYEARVHGRFAHLVGRVYKQFDPGKHVISDSVALDRVRALVADPTIPKGLVVDPHDRKPFFAAWFLVDRDGALIFFHEWPPFDFHKTKSSNLDVEGYARLFQEEEQRLGVSSVWYRLMDPNYGIMRRVISDQSIRDRFDDFGLHFDTDIDDSIQSGHLAVKQRLNDGKLFLMPECRNLRFSLDCYCWADGANTTSDSVKERPADVGKDGADCIRYASMVVGPYFNPVDCVPRVDLDMKRAV